MEASVQSALKIVQDAGYVTIPGNSTMLFPFIKELTELLEGHGYHVDKAEMESTGRIMVGVFPIGRIVQLQKAKEIQSVQQG